MVEHQSAAATESATIKELRTAFRAAVGSQRYEVWFRRTTHWALDADQLTVSVPNAFSQDWLRTHFREQIEAVAAQVLGQPTNITFQVDAAIIRRSQLHDSDPRGLSTPSPSSATTSAPQHLAQCSPAQSAHESTESSPISGNAGLKMAAGTAPPRRREALPQRVGKPKRCTLENFVAGDCNQLARTSASLALGQLGQTNPLVLHGPHGVGKTHLAEAICTAARARYRLNAIYLTAEQFTTLFLEALNGKGLPSFRHRYRTVDVLAIDDVQFFAGKRATLIEFLATLETLLRTSRQLVLTCDAPPGDLQALGGDLQGNLKAGLVCRIDPPEFATRLEILNQLCQFRGLHFDAEVRHLVATKVTGTARELSGAVCRLQATSLATGEPIDLQLAESILVELAAETTRAVGLSDIERAVCDVCGVDRQALHSTQRTRQVSYPRMIAMFLARKHTRAALGEIGQFFGRRSHSTVISAGKRVEAWMRDSQTLQLAERALPVDDVLRRVEERLRTG